MNALEQEVNAALKAIKNKDKSIAKDLEKTAGYAVFPSVGRAGVVLGGAYGHGLLFEKNESIGEVTVGQFTIGIQLGGQSFRLLLIFCTKDALERIKHGRIAFSANASAVIAKAAASGAGDFERDVVAKAYSKGGMLLELSLGGQGFRFRPKATLQHPTQPEPKPEPKHQKKAG
jgi:lipid-binding SYLF domain-containing protein